MSKKSLFVFGLGYSGREVARQALAQGFSVAGSCRSAEKCVALRAEGIKAVEFTSVTTDFLADFSYILSTIPPQSDGGRQMTDDKESLNSKPQTLNSISALPGGERGYSVAGGDVVLPILPVKNQWLGYFSTTGVYGDCGGDWVSEESEPRPNNERLHRRVDAEKQWRGRGGHVFRLAGIYGTGRSAIDNVLAGTARRIDKKGQVFSRIHVADIARIVLASMNKPNPEAVYNVCDDEPASAADVVVFACGLLEKPVLDLIPFEKAELSASGREFYSANRRVKNERIKQELGVELLYPTYREGLAAIKVSL